MESGINDDTVRSMAELINSEPRHQQISHDDTDLHVNINMEKELKRRGFPTVTRMDSQSPESLVAKRRKEPVK